MICPKPICSKVRNLFAGLLRLAFAAIFAVHGAPLNWEHRNGYRFAPLDVPNTTKTGFTLLTPSTTGIFFTNQISYARTQKNQNLLHGAGVAAGDFNGDGLCDLFFANAEGACGLFRNLGDWKFVNATAESGVACTNQISKSALFADLDGDGKLDLLVSSIGGPNAFFINLGE